MGQQQSYTRRDVVRLSANVSAAGIIGVIVSGCGGSEDGTVCASPDDWSMSEAGLRKANNYVESSPHTDKNCLNCAFFKADPGATCGQCDIFTGVAHKDGYCDSWSEIPS